MSHTQPHEDMTALVDESLPADDGQLIDTCNGCELVGELLEDALERSVADLEPDPDDPWRDLGDGD
jgi:hypothetical protein